MRSSFMEQQKKNIAKIFILFFYLKHKIKVEIFHTKKLKGKIKKVSFTAPKKVLNVKYFFCL